MQTALPTNNEDSLRLTGNQIKLATRTLENNSTASSRCALLGRGVSRCASVVPLLNLRYNEFDYSKTSRRPFSADFPFEKFENPYQTKMTSYSPDIASSSEEETDGNLPSSQLYQNLLSEPLHSWRDGVRFTSSNKHKKFKKITNGSAKLSETSGSPDTVSDADSLSEKDILHLNLNPKSSHNNLVKTIKDDLEEKSCNQINAIEEQCKNLSSPKNTNPMILLPGLKTKPPLPRKSDPNNSYELKSISNRISSGDGAETNLQDNKMLSDNSDEGISTTTLDSNSETIDLKYQNWMEDEHKANNDILKSELDTDLSLHNLKFHNQTETPTSGTKQILTSSRKPTLKKNQSEPFNVQFLKSEYEKHKSQFQSKKNFIKENMKLHAKGNKKAPNSRTNYASDTSNQIKNSAHQFSNTQQVANVESWMSSKQNSTENIIKGDNVGLKPLRQSSYLEFLNTIDELEEGHGKCSIGNILEHDIDSSFVEQDDGNTYDDIAAILQVLEQEDKKSHNNMESIKEILDSELSSTTNEATKENVVDSQLNLDEFANTHCSSKCDGNALEDYFGPRLGLYRQIGETTEILRSPINSTTNLNDIITYLDEVDKNCAKTVACAKERVNCATQVLQSNVMALDTIPKIEELLKRTNEELSNYIVDLSLRVKEKASAIALLQKELSALRQQVTKINKDSGDIIKQRLKSQKEDYETVVKRHQKFIDQLIADKKTLNQQCEGLLHEMKVLEDRYNSNLKAAEHKHKVEMIKFKEMHMAGEKMRKDRWIDVKTQKIKELTIKGLEPELDSMASRHQQEISDIRAFHKREIEDLELRNTRKMQQHCEALREQLTIEREKAIAREREILKLRYDKMVELEEQNFQEQRRKLLSEHSSRLLDCEDRENLAIQERDKAIKTAQADFEDKLQASLRRHNTELNALKEKTELEIEAFRNNYKKQVTIQLGEKEIQIRDRCKKERDKEIEAVIERLEMESEETKSHIEQSTENRIKRHKEKYDQEIRDLEKLEKETSTKYAETKNRLLETEDVVISLRTTIKHLEFQLTDTKNIADRLSGERHKVKEIVKEEAKLEVTALQKELQELKIEKEKEMQQVYARVKLAVARKDETLTELSRDNASLQEKCTYLENMLEQQRKEYLINKRQH